MAGWLDFGGVTVYSSTPPIRLWSREPNMKLTSLLSENMPLKHRAVRWMLQPSLLQRITLQGSAYIGSRMSKYPGTDAALLQSKLMTQWWYYSIELMKGCITKGIYPPEFPFLPRILMAKAELDGMECLDLGSMEGVLPVLMSRRGAKRVLATDAIYHCYRKLLAVQHYHNVRFDFRQVGSMYGLSGKLGRAGSHGFDLINVSGLLYHVYSPFHVLAGVRPLLKPNGIMIVSTNVTETSDHTMAFNTFGGFQKEANTFWYISVPMMEYMLRYFCLEPIDSIYRKRDDAEPGMPENGYLSVVCRAVESSGLTVVDSWAAESRDKSWEYIDAAGMPLLRRLKDSHIAYHVEEPAPDAPFQLAGSYLDRQIVTAQTDSQSHTLHLDDQV